MKKQIIKSLQKIGHGVLIGSGIILSVGVFGTIYAYTALPTQTTGDQLTDTIWNDVINRINDIGTKAENNETKTADIYNNGGNIGIGEVNPSTKLEVSGDLKVTGELNINGGYIVRKSVVQVNSANHSTTTSRKLGPSFPTIPDFKAGSLVKLSYHMPMRNDSTSWGGGYVEPQISFDGGSTRQSLGSSGYDGGVMNTSAGSIGSYSNTLLIDPSKSSDFSVTVRFYFRSYDATVTINQSHDINNISGTASLMSGVNGTQHYARVLVEELQ